MEHITFPNKPMYEHTCQWKVGKTLNPGEDSSFLEQRQERKI